jgi:hypothetical protein
LLSITILIEFKNIKLHLEKKNIVVWGPYHLKDQNENLMSFSLTLTEAILRYIEAEKKTIKRGWSKANHPQVWLG